MDDGCLLACHQAGTVVLVELARLAREEAVVGWSMDLGTGQRKRYRQQDDQDDGKTMVGRTS